MAISLAAYFNSLRQRFPAHAQQQISDGQTRFEQMLAMERAERPADSRCAFFEIAGTRFLVWEMDGDCDRFQVFATIYNVSMGEIRLSTKPKGIVNVAGFPIDLEILADFIEKNFREARRAPVGPDGNVKKRKLLLFGFSESFGHHIWNEVSGLAALIETGQIDGFDGCIVGPFDYFYLELFLRQRFKQVWKFNSMGSLLSDQLYWLPYTVVTEEARRLLISHAAAETAGPLMPQPGQRAFCFQIRRHRRPWEQEEEGLAAIITACARQWPGSVFYLDGHGTSKGVIPVYGTRIDDEMSFAARLLQRIDPGIDLRLTVGMDMNEKINTLKNVDVFVGPIGSGGVLSSWLLRKPTVGYGHSSLYDMAAFQEEKVPEGGPMTSLVPVELIRDGAPDLASFDVDADSILQLIRHEILKKAAA